jgi:hypothetical protein
MAINTISSKVTRQIFNKSSSCILFHKSAFKSTTDCLHILNKYNNQSPDAYKYLSLIKTSLYFQQSVKFSINCSTRFNSENTNKNVNLNNVELLSLKTAVKYGLFVLVGVVGGVVTGYWLMLDQSKIGYDNETKRTIKYEANKLVRFFFLKIYFFLNSSNFFFRLRR